MLASCKAPIPEEALLDYWARDVADGDETERVEEHLFACSDCSARLHQPGGTRGRAGHARASRARLGDRFPRHSQPLAA